MEKLKAFLRRKDIEISIKRYGIDALGAMAQGLFCSLLIGTIINTLGTQFHISFLTTAVATVNDTQYTVGSLASAMSGPAMAVAIGYALHCPPLVLFSLITVGFASNALGGAGGPLAVLFVAIFASEIGKAVSKETKIDILVTPLVTIGIGVALSAWWAPALGSAAMKVGNIIMWATNLQPFLMGIIVSVLMGMILTLPISSAALGVILNLSGLAAGAATVGCCCNMVGFAVASYRENKVGGLLAQGIGTSMLQVPNIVKKPVIWLPAIISSAILGPVGTMVLDMTNNATGSGMGTAGLVGQIMTWQTMIQTESAQMVLIKILLIQIVLPAVVTLGVSEFMRKKDWIKMGDMKLEF